MRLEIPYPEQFMAIITQTIDQGNMPPNAIPLILDIDVFREVILDPRSDQVWDDFEVLRSHKNEIFFNSITPKAQELFR